MAFYHLSKVPNLSILFPRIPCLANSIEDTSERRVSVAESIDNCLLALSPKGEEFYVYEILLDEEEVVFPENLKTKVPDVEFTNEFWIKDLVACKMIGKIFAISNSFETKTNENGIKIKMPKNIKWGFYCD